MQCECGVASTLIVANCIAHHAAKMSFPTYLDHEKLLGSHQHAHSIAGKAATAIGTSFGVWDDRRSYHL